MKPDIDFALLARMNLPRRSAAEAETVFREGDAADQMFIVHSGRVAIEHNGKVLDELGPGDPFGEMALVDGTPRSATARCTQPCELLVLNEKSFLFLVDEMPYFALKMMRIMAHRLRAMNERV